MSEKNLSMAASLHKRRKMKKYDEPPVAWLHVRNYKLQYKLPRVTWSSTILTTCASCATLAKPSLPFQTNL